MMCFRRVLLLTLALLHNLCATNCIAPELPFGDINVVVLTDIHAWVGGHGIHEGAKLDADFGDILSFYERLKFACYEAKQDLWFVMNGDFNHGTGLSTNPPISLVPLLEKMPWDAVNLGNHELYETETVSYITEPGGYVHWFGDRFLTSNVAIESTSEPVGRRYRFLRGQKSTVLTFGFLYDMQGASPLVTVELIEDVVRSEWFVNALREQFDAILVLAHMDLQDPLVDVILSAIRTECGSYMPVQFITGHTHYRGYQTMDTYSTSFEAGRYLDTVGFVSFPSKQNATADANMTSLFQHEFLDANVATLRDKLGVTQLKTESGAALSRFIENTQQSMGLMERVGCARKSFYLDKALHEKDSLWGFYVREVIPNHFTLNNASRIVLLSNGALRYSLFKGDVTVDDVHSVAPFNDTLYCIAAGIPGSIILELNQTLNPADDIFNALPSLPAYILSASINAEDKYHLFVAEFEIEKMTRLLADIYDGDLMSQRSGASTTSLLFSFIEDAWPCSGTRKRPEHPMTDETLTLTQMVLNAFFLLAAIDITAVVILMGVIMFRKLHRRTKPTPVQVESNGHKQYDSWESGTFA